MKIKKPLFYQIIGLVISFVVALGLYLSAHQGNDDVPQIHPSPAISEYTRSFKPIEVKVEGLPEGINPKVVPLYGSGLTVPFNTNFPVFVTDEKGRLLLYSLAPMTNKNVTITPLDTAASMVYSVMPLSLPDDQRVHYFELIKNAPGVQGLAGKISANLRGGKEFDDGIDDVFMDAYQSVVRELGGETAFSSARYFASTEIILPKKIGSDGAVAKMEKRVLISNSVAAYRSLRWENSAGSDTSLHLFGSREPLVDPATLNIPDWYDLPGLKSTMRNIVNGEYKLTIPGETEFSYGSGYAAAGSYTGVLTIRTLKAGAVNGLYLTAQAVGFDPEFKLCMNQVNQNAVGALPGIGQMVLDAGAGRLSWASALSLAFDKTKGVATACLQGAAVNFAGDHFGRIGAIAKKLVNNVVGKTINAAEMGWTIAGMANGWFASKDFAITPSEVKNQCRYLFVSQGRALLEIIADRSEYCPEDGRDLTEVDVSPGNNAPQVPSTRNVPYSNFNTKKNMFMFGQIPMRVYRGQILYDDVKDAIAFKQPKSYMSLDNRPLVFDLGLIDLVSSSGIVIEGAASSQKDADSAYDYLKTNYRNIRNPGWPEQPQITISCHAPNCVW